MTHIDYINGTQIKAVASTATNTKDIFIMFMAREGFDVVIATSEFALIDGKTEATYLSASRLGMTAIGGRAVRKNVFATYNNAKNHASFAQ